MQLNLLHLVYKVGLIPSYCIVFVQETIHTTCMYVQFLIVLGATTVQWRTVSLRHYGRIFVSLYLQKKPLFSLRLRLRKLFANSSKKKPIIRIIFFRVLKFFFSNQVINIKFLYIKANDLLQILAQYECIMFNTEVPYKCSFLNSNREQFSIELDTDL